MAAPKRLTLTLITVIALFMTDLGNALDNHSLHTSHSLGSETPCQNFSHSLVIFAFSPDYTPSRKTLDKRKKVGRSRIFARVNISRYDVRDDLGVCWYEL